MSDVPKPLGNRFSRSGNAVHTDVDERALTDQFVGSKEAVCTAKRGAADPGNPRLHGDEVVQMDPGAVAALTVHNRYPGTLIQ